MPSCCIYGMMQPTPAEPIPLLGNGLTCLKVEGTMAMKPVSTPSPTPPAVKSHHSPCSHLLQCPWAWLDSHWAPAVCAGRWDLLPVLFSTSSTQCLLFCPFKFRERGKLLDFFKCAQDCLSLPDPREEDGSVVYLFPFSSYLHVHYCCTKLGHIS